jgi:hypothetical protein
VSINSVKDMLKSRGTRVNDNDIDIDIDEYHIGNSENKGTPSLTYHRPATSGSSE